MRLYQLHMSIEAGLSAGFAYFTSFREAQKAATTFMHDNRVECQPSYQINIVVAEPTKAGILALLKRYASHPDNG